MPPTSTVTVSQAFALALEHQRARRLAEAEALYRQILAVQPNHVDALHFLGVVADLTGRHETAVECIRRAIVLNPNHSAAHSNLGAALAELGRLEEAAAAYRQALALNPNAPETHNNLGIALAGLGQLEEAIIAYQRALQLKPDLPETYLNLGNALRIRGQINEALAAYRRALQLRPDYPQVYISLGNALKEHGELDEALTAHRRAEQLTPHDPDVHINLGNVLKDHGRMGEAVAAYRRALELKPGYIDAHSNLILAAHYDPAFDERSLQAEHQRWERQHARPLRKFIQPHTNSPDPSRRLKIGYVSPDFLDNVVGRNLVPLFRCHDHERFQILCYSGGLKPDGLTAEFQRRADQWRNTVGVTDESLAEMIRQDGVDILVDLTQHAAHNRLPVFARCPAPVQVSFAGYPASTGLEAIGYRISDRYLEGGRGNSDFGIRNSDVLTARSVQSNIDLPTSNMVTEQVCLIDSFWCYDPCGVEVGVNGLPAQETGRVTFGCLNNFCKISEPVLRLWARVLRQVENSHLVLQTGAGSHRQRTRDILEQEGVEAGRVEFVGRRSRRAYLELYHRLDMVLDPFPYNGHTTSLDALWMGVPVVSLAGEQSVSRAGWSQLSHLGLEELVAFSEDDYAAIATRLAQNLPRLTELRATLRTRMETSRLMDAPQFARDIETAYRTMWQQWCAAHPSGKR